MKVLVNKKRTYVYGSILSIFLLSIGFTVYAIASGNAYYKLVAWTNQIQLWTPPNTFTNVSDHIVAEHGKSRIFGTNTCPQDIFVPTKTTGEWDSFVSGKPVCITTTNTPTWRDWTFTGTTLVDYDCRRYNTNNWSYVQKTTVAQLVNYYNSCTTLSYASEPDWSTIYCRNPSLDSSYRTLYHITWHQNGLWGCNMGLGSSTTIRLYSL